MAFDNLVQEKKAGLKDLVDEGKTTFSDKVPMGAQFVKQQKKVFMDKYK